MRRQYGSYSGELIEYVLAPLVYRCLLAEGLFPKDAVMSLSERVGVVLPNEDDYLLETVLEKLDERWKASEKFHQVTAFALNKTRLANMSSDFRVEFVCSLFEEDSLLEAAHCLVFMSELSGSQLPSNLRDSYEGSLLHHVASEGGARLLIDLLPCSCLINSRQRDGKTPLHHSSPQVAKYLVSRGADVNAKSRSGVTPLFVANSAASVLCLLKLGASPVAVNNFYRHTPLHLATSHGLWEVIWFLLRGGIDPGHRGKDGLTALELCKVLIASPLPSDTQQQKNSLIKVQRILEIWDLSAQPQPIGITSSEDLSLHYERFETRCCAAAHSRICKDPAMGLAVATNLPLEVASLILDRYVSVFTGADDLKDISGNISPAYRRCYVQHTSTQDSGNIATLSKSIMRQCQIGTVIAHNNKLNILIATIAIFLLWCRVWS